MSISLLYEQDPGFLSALLVRQSEDYENFAKGIYGLLRQAKEIAEESGDVRYESDNREDEIDELRDKLDTIYRKAIATDTRSFKSEQKDFVEYVVRLAEEE